MSTHRKLSLALAVIALSLGSAMVILAGDSSPKPTPAHQRMAAYAGHWRFTQEFESTPFSPAGKGTKKSNATQTLGGFFLEERGQGKGPDGDYHWLSVTAYDPDKQQYQQFTFDDRGFSSRPDHGEVTLGTEKSGVWTWTWDEEAQGKVYHCQAIDTFAPDGKSYSYQWRYSEDRQNWKPWLKGTATRH